MRSRIQTELKVLKSLTENSNIQLLINQLESFLLHDDEEIEKVVMLFRRDCFILAYGLGFLADRKLLNDEDKKIQSDAFYLYNQLGFLL